MSFIFISKILEKKVKNQKSILVKFFINAFFITSAICPLYGVKIEKVISNFKKVQNFIFSQIKIKYKQNSKICFSQSLEITFSYHYNTYLFVSMYRIKSYKIKQLFRLFSQNQKSFMHGKGYYSEKSRNIQPTYHTSKLLNGVTFYLIVLEIW